MTGDDKHFPELTDSEKILWRAVNSDMDGLSTELRQGTATPEDIEASLNRLTSHGIDPDTLANALHIPDDAGPHAQALEQILRRIPDGWGRWISLDAGWYPIVVALDARLAALDPDYVVHQVKEKFGTLRYYCEPSAPKRRHLWDAFAASVREAEKASAITCERCGNPGIMHQHPMRIKTLCATCAGPLGYLPKPADGTA